MPHYKVFADDEFLPIPPSLEFPVIHENGDMLSVYARLGFRTRISRAFEKMGRIWWDTETVKRFNSSAILETK